MEYPVDQGTAFGTWPDQTSRFMYHDIMPTLLSGVNTYGRVADYGGANGLLRQWIPQAVTVDHDASKRPDVVADIRFHVGNYDLIVMRYVLHYLTDFEVLELMAHLRATHKGDLLIIQFVAENEFQLAEKSRNSWGEEKHFRTRQRLGVLLDPGNRPLPDVKAVQYRVDPEFYRNRLGHPNPTPHRETVVAYYFKAAK